MSHVATVELEVRDLDSLAQACAALGLELVRGQQRYRWYGMSVGDYPLPAGFTQEDLGRCDHCIRIAGSSSEGEDGPYEIGIVARRDGRPGYQLLWDFWAQGKGMQKHVGDGCRELKKHYALAVATKQARAQGFQVTHTIGANGSIQVRLTK